MKRLILLAFLFPAAPAHSETFAADWVAAEVFRDAVETSDAVPFIAPMTTGTTFRANGFSDLGRYDGSDDDETVELRLDGPPDAPVLHARLLRRPDCGGVNEFETADVDLAAPAAGAPFRTARFPSGRSQSQASPFVALAWTPPAAPGRPFPVFGVYPDARGAVSRDALARPFLRDPAGALASDGAAASLRPFVLWIGGESAPAALPPPPRAAKPVREPGLLAFPDLPPRAAGGGALATVSTNVLLTETLRARVQLRVSASSAEPAAEQRLRLHADCVFDERPAPRRPWIAIPGSSGSFVREGRWRARAGGGFELRGDFRPRRKPGDGSSAWEHKLSQYWGRPIRAGDPERMVLLVMSVDAPAPEELEDPTHDVPPAAAVLRFHVSEPSGPKGGFPHPGPLLAELRVPLRVALSPAPPGAGGPPPPAIPPAEVRALAARVRALDGASARTVLSACTGALARVSAAFDPAWDVDIDRDARRRARQAERAAVDPATAYVPWTSVRNDPPEDALQAAIADLRAACVDALFAAAGRDRAAAELAARRKELGDVWPQILRDDRLLVQALHARPALARALEIDALCHRLRTIGAGDGLAFQAMRGRIRALVEATLENAPPDEAAALVLPVLRTVQAMPFDWDAFRVRADGSADWERHPSWHDQTSRFDFAKEILQPLQYLTAGSCAPSFRAAELMRPGYEGAARTKDVRVGWNPQTDADGEPRRDASGKILFGVWRLSFAKAFWDGAYWISGALFHIARDIVAADPPVLARPFFEELGSLSGFGAFDAEIRAARERGPDDSDRNDRGDLVGKLVHDHAFFHAGAHAAGAPPTGPATGASRDAAAAASAAAARRESGGEPVRLGIYHATPALQAELDRYGLEAGVALRAPFDARDPANRQPYLLYAPTNAPPGARLPLVFFAPGSGELGHELVKQFRQRGIFEKICSPDFQARHPCFLLVMPPEEGKQARLYGSLPGGLPTREQCFLLDALLAVAKSRTGPSVDEDRLVGAGLISGSTELLGLARNFPRFFAALALTAPMSAVQDVPAAAPTRRWDFHAEGAWGYRADDEGEARRARLDEAVRAAGGDIRRTVFPPSGRTVWDQAWETDELWDWLFAWRRPDPPARRILRTPAGRPWSFELVR